MKERKFRKGVKTGLSRQKKDLEVSKILFDTENCEWASFAAQQAFEKALEAVLEKFGRKAWRHSAYELLKVVESFLNIDVDEEVSEGTKFLDKYYIISKYPNGWISGTPHDFITKKEAEDAILYSGKIIRFCESILHR